MQNWRTLLVGAGQTRRITDNWVLQTRTSWRGTGSRGSGREIELQQLNAGRFTNGETSILSCISGRGRLRGSRSWTARWRSSSWRTRGWSRWVARSGPGADCACAGEAAAGAGGEAAQEEDPGPHRHRLRHRDGQYPPLEQTRLLTVLRWL